MTKVGTTGATAAIGAAVAGPVGAVGGAMVGDAVGELILDPIINIKKKKEVVDGFWPLLAKALEVGGWIVGLFILIPLVLGIVMPTPKFRRKTQRRSKK